MASLNKDIDLMVYGRAIWMRRDVLFSTIAVVMLVVILALHVVERQYTVTAQVSPVISNSAQVNGGLGGLAKLAGVDMSTLTGGQTQFNLFLKALTGRDVANILARDQNLMRRIFPREWSREENRWRQPPSPLRGIAHLVENAVGYPVVPWQPPDGERLAQYLADHLETYEDPKSPVVTLQMQAPDPAATIFLFQKMMSAVDAMLRQRALSRANDYVDYLTRELDKVTVADYRQSLLENLSEQEKMRMMASANVSFSAQVFNAPVASTRPTAPKVIVLLIFFLFVGAILGSVLAILADRLGWKSVSATVYSIHRRIPHASKAGG